MQFAFTLDDEEATMFAVYNAICIPRYAWNMPVNASERNMNMTYKMDHT